MYRVSCQCNGPLGQIDSGLCWVNTPLSTTQSADGPNSRRRPPATVKPTSKRRRLQRDRGERERERGVRPWRRAAAGDGAGARDWSAAGAPAAAAAGRGRRRRRWTMTPSAPSSPASTTTSTSPAAPPSATHGSSHPPRESSPLPSSLTMFPLLLLPRTLCICVWVSLGMFIFCSNLQYNTAGIYYYEIRRNSLNYYSAVALHWTLLPGFYA